MLKELWNIKDDQALQAMCRGWIENELQTKSPIHEANWSASLAVGSLAYVDAVKETLGLKVRKRSIVEMNDEFAIREESSDYGVDFGSKNSHISTKKAVF